MVKKIVGTGVLLVLALALQAGVKMYTLKSPDDFFYHIQFL